MIRIEYKKLIRDRITEFMDAEGSKYETRILDDESFKDELLKKIVEEANEVLDARDSEQDLISEISDLLEVIDAIILAFGLRKDEVLNVKECRKLARGGFERRIYLESAESKRN